MLKQEDLGNGGRKGRASKWKAALCLGREGSSIHKNPLKDINSKLVCCIFRQSVVSSKKDNTKGIKFWSVSFIPFTQIKSHMTKLKLPQESLSKIIHSLFYMRVGKQFLQILKLTWGVPCLPLRSWESKRYMKILISTQELMLYMCSQLL